MPALLEAYPAGGMVTWRPGLHSSLPTIEKSNFTVKRATKFHVMSTIRFSITITNRATAFDLDVFDNV